MPEAGNKPLEPWLQLSAAGGVNHGLANHRFGRDDEVDHLENATVRGGAVTTRPGFHWLGDFPQDCAVNLDVLRHGKIQGSGFYSFADDPLFCYAIDGHLFGLDPRSGMVVTLDPIEGENPFAQDIDFVFFEQRSNFMLASDGEITVVIDGRTPRFAESIDGEVPPCLMMADGWGYLCVCDPDRRRVQISDHEMSPIETVTPLTFNETDAYYLGAESFTVPRRIGRITGMRFMPWASTDTGFGPLCVFGEEGVVTYDLSVPRSQWAVQDISSIILNRTGSVSHKGLAEWGNDLWFVDQHGRIQSVRAAASDEGTRRVKQMDRRVYQYYRDQNDDPSLRRWRQMVSFDNRIITTIWPTAEWVRRAGKDRYSVAHEGMVVWEGDVTESVDLATDRDIWAGVWTGIRPAALDAGLAAPGPSTSGEEWCIALSVDSDGENRFYRMTKNARDDVAIEKDGIGGVARTKRIKMTVAPTRSEFGLPFDKKRARQAFMFLSGHSGQIDIDAEIESDCEEPEPWFTHTDSSSNCMSFADKCEIDWSRPACTPHLAAPAFSSDASTSARCESVENFYSMRPIYTIEGHVTIESIGINVELPPGAGKRTTNVARDAPSPVPGVYGKGSIPLRTYDAVLAAPSPEALV